MEVISMQQLALMERKFAKRKIQINLECKYIFIRETKYKVIDEAIKLLEWKQVSSETECHIFWKDTYISDDEYRKLLPYQRINHFPGSYLLGKKNELCRNLNRMRKQFPDEYDFFPKTWQLPFQSEELRNRHGIYIVKPEANCQGRGIFITKKLEPYLDKHYVVQEYLANPFLIDDLKFDLRIYVLLKSVCPLKIFMYKEGLARFSTKKYVKPQKKNLHNMTMHLTNYAINKKSKDFIFNQGEQDDVGHKRSFSSILTLLQSQGHDTQALLKNMSQNIVKTICSCLPDLQHLYRSGQHGNETSEQCFELFGFDILLDNNLKPWIIEVNHTPSFSIDTPLDKTIKLNLIQDTLILLDIRNKPKEQYLLSKRAPIFQRQQKLTQQEKDEQEEKITKYENSHMHGYHRIYPDNNIDYSPYIPAKPKERPQTAQITQTVNRKRLSTNQSFSEFESNPQLTNRMTVVSQQNSVQMVQQQQIVIPRQASQRRPISSTIAAIPRPASGVKRQMPLIQQRPLVYPPCQEINQKPTMKMIPIKTFQFDKISFTKSE